MKVKEGGGFSVTFEAMEGLFESIFMIRVGSKKSSMLRHRLQRNSLFDIWLDVALVEAENPISVQMSSLFWITNFRKQDNRGILQQLKFRLSCPNVCVINENESTCSWLFFYPLQPSLVGLK